MKCFYTIYIIIACTFFVSGCLQNKNSVKSIILTIDPNKTEGKYRVIRINSNDSTMMFMSKFINRKLEYTKFYPRYSIEINYADRTEKFLGNANHVKDNNGHTYKLLAKQWELYDY